MNRIIFERNHPTNVELYTLGKIYDYPHNPGDYACVDVDTETLCYLKLKSFVWEHTLSDKKKAMPDMPTYVYHYELPEWNTLQSNTSM